MATAATATTDPHVHLLPTERTAGLMRWLHRGLPGVPIPKDITWEGALADLRAAGARWVVNLLFPLRAGEAEELHRFGAALSAREPDVVPVGGVLGSVALAPEPARPGLVDKVADLFDAAPERIFFGTDYPAAMGSLDELHRQVAESPVGGERSTEMAANAARFTNEAFGLDLERAQSSKVRP